MRDLPKRLVANALEAGKVAVMVAVPAVLLMTHVENQYKITELGYEISEATDRHEKLKDEHRKLQIEATVESRSDRLSRIGRERFGLEPVQPEQIVDVETRRLDDSSDGALDETEHAALENRRTEGGGP